MYVVLAWSCWFCVSVVEASECLAPRSLSQVNVAGVLEGTKRNRRKTKPSTHIQSSSSRTSHGFYQKTLIYPGSHLANQMPSEALRQFQNRGVWRTIVKRPAKAQPLPVFSLSKYRDWGLSSLCCTWQTQHFLLKLGVFSQGSLRVPCKWHVAWG